MSVKQEASHMVCNYCKYPDCHDPSHYKHTHTQMQAEGSGVMVSPLSAVYLCVCPFEVVKCVLGEPAVTSLQDTAGHNSH